MNEILQKIIDELDGLRIDVDIECQYCDPTGMLRQKYEAENDMLDECIDVVKSYIQMK
jgi:hypothetical protein